MRTMRTMGKYQPHLILRDDRHYDSPPTFCFVDVSLFFVTFRKRSPFLVSRWWCSPIHFICIICNIWRFAVSSLLTMPRRHIQYSVPTTVLFRFQIHIDDRQLSAIWLSHSIIKWFGWAQMSSSRRTQHQPIPVSKFISGVVASVSNVCLLPHLTNPHAFGALPGRLHLSIYASVVAIYCFVVSPKRTFHADKWEIRAAILSSFSKPNIRFRFCVCARWAWKIPNLGVCRIIWLLWLNAWAHLRRLGPC